MSRVDWVQERKAQVYEDLLEEVAALQDDWEQLYDDPAWEEQTRLDQKIVRHDDPAIHQQVQEYLDAREDCLALLDEASMYGDALKEEFKDESGFRFGPYSSGTTFSYKLGKRGRGREYELGLDEMIGDYGDELAELAGRNDFTEFMAENRIYPLRKLENIVGGEEQRDRRIWWALSDRPERDIASFATRFNMAYADLLDEAERLDTMIEHQLEKDLLAADGHEIDIPDYAS